jgi:hypothetical protein
MVSTIGTCTCGQWRKGGLNPGLIETAHRVHVAAAIAQAVAARDEGEAVERVSWLCSQCEEMPSVMVKAGTSDGWCEDCLDRAAYPPEDSRKILLWAADEMAAVISDGDVAEVAAHVEGEVGRSACIERRDRLYEEPVEWLRDLAAASLLATAPAAGDGLRALAVGWERETCDDWTCGHDECGAKRENAADLRAVLGGDDSGEVPS